MAELTIAQAAAWCGGTYDEKYANVVFNGAVNDSRQVRHGRLFLALQGTRDGHEFIPMAIKKGAAAVLCTHCREDVPALIVPDVRLALGQIAKGVREKSRMKVVGITGSVGKSTTKEMVACVLSRAYVTEKTPANHNNDIGLPMALLDMPDDVEVAVLEMGMNHFGEISYLTRIAQPDLAVITNIGTMHMENLGSQAGILKAKLEILEGMPKNGQIVLNGDDRHLWEQKKLPVAVTYAGIRNGECDLVARDLREEDGKITFRACYDGREIPIMLPIEGLHFVPDALSAICVGLLMGMEEADIAAALAGFRNMEGRLEICQVRGITVIKDWYNAGPESMAAALVVLGKQPGRRIAVLGDMLELGNISSAEHFRIGRIAASVADYVLAYGPMSAQVVKGCLTGGMPPSRARAFEDPDSLGAVLESLAEKGDALLIKGSHGMHMERIAGKFLKEKT
ncbi:MAG: UDP-N-acetylmuramoyl-tripeptide--D-alanyl-D-alanine ligase [Firmicutes bacterium]|nr:UDP-N-acetylmuramoyl-tripeptide--D-alanyl-D-alanine ligase [Bacillota bacterium]